MRPTLVVQTVLAGLLFSLAGSDTHLGTAQPGPLPTGSNVTPGPRFVVKVYSFQALDETGWDWLGSDEVVFTFRTPKYALITEEKRSVDSDDGPPFYFARKDECVMPAEDATGRDGVWSCSEAGVSAPLSFIVGAYEQDMRWSLGFSSPNYGGADGDIFRLPTKFDQEDSPNDLIGKEDVHLSLSTLLQKLPFVGASFQERLDLFGACDGSTTTAPCTSGVAPHYVVVLSVTRVRDVSAPVDPNP